MAARLSLMMSRKCPEQGTGNCSAEGSRQSRHGQAVGVQQIEVLRLQDGE